MSLPDIEELVTSLPALYPTVYYSGVINVGPFLGAFASSGITLVSFVICVGLSVCPSVRLCQRTSYLRVYVKFDIGAYEICRVNPNLIKIEQKYRALYMKTEVRSVVAYVINSP
jgi:hypothetical protein